MKKKLIAWMMSATMALGSMTLPVYAENEEVAVEFSDETDEETEEPETEMLDIPEEMFTPIFAIARIAGWSAHRLEEVAINGKIMRPAYKNIGEHKEYIPMEKR